MKNFIIGLIILFSIIAIISSVILLVKLKEEEKYINDKDKKMLQSVAIVNIILSIIFTLSYLYYYWKICEYKCFDENTLKPKKKLHLLFLILLCIIGSITFTSNISTIKLEEKFNYLNIINRILLLIAPMFFYQLFIYNINFSVKTN